MELLITFLLGLFIIVGAVITNVVKNRKFIEQISIAIAFGTMVSLAVMDLLPEALEYLGERNIVLLVLFVIIGVAILKVLDHFIPEHENDHDGDYEDENMVHIGIAASIAIVIHNLIEGMAVYSIATQSVRVGLLMTIGVGLHNIPMGMMIFSALKTQKTKIKYGIMAAVTFSTFVGGVMMTCISSLLNEFVMGMLVGIALGMLTYIALFELLPYCLYSKPRKTIVIGIIIGVAIMFISSLLG